MTRSSPLPHAQLAPAVLAAVCGMLLGGCREVPAGPARRTPVINFTLIAGDSLQFATIAEAVRADSGIPNQPPVVAPERVALAVHDQNGVAYPLTPTPVAGRYVARLTPRPGERYGLAGAIDGLPVWAETVTPGRFVVLLPGADTIVNPIPAGAGLRADVPYVFDAEGASGYGYLVLTTDGVVELSARLQSPEGMLVVFRAPGVRELLLLAYNVDAAEWLVRTTPRSNLVGAFGMFGGALMARRWVVFQ